MEAQQFITKAGASFSVTYLLSFKRPKDFVDRYVDDLFQDMPGKERRKLLYSFVSDAKKLVKDAIH